MAVENAQYIGELDATLPRKSDDLEEGDDHIRISKSAIKATFPGVGGGGYNTAILATEQDLNYCTDIDSNIQDQIDLLSTGESGAGERFDLIEADIVSLNLRVGDLEVRMGVVEGDIITLDGRVNTNIGNITILQDEMDDVEDDIVDLFTQDDGLQSQIDFLGGVLSAGLGTDLLFSAGEIPPGWALVNLAKDYMIRLTDTNTAGVGGTDDPFNIASTPWTPNYTRVVVGTKT